MFRGDGMAEDGVAPQGHLVAGRYRLLRMLAAGGLGRVWLADDETLHRRVAIKRCALPGGLTGAEQDLVRGLTVREARAFARVDHPNVIRILDVLPDEDEPWIVMEYLASRSLLQVIQESGALSPARAAAVGLAVLHGLNAASRAGVLHLDVKPANVLIGDDGRIVLSDFGPAVTDEGVRALAGVGIILGSPKYIAPERLSGGPSTAQADLWSLGATLYHAVEGRPPYVRKTTEATLQALAGSMPDPPRKAGPLAGVLEGLLRRDPADRLSPAEVEERLSRVADQPEPPAAAVSPPIRRPMRRRVAAVGAVLAVAAALAAVAAGARHDDPVGAPSTSPSFSASRAPLVLPAGYGWWNDPGGFRVAVPSGWERGRSDAGVLTFTAARGWPSLWISAWPSPSGDVVAALLARERDVRLRSYRRIRIEALPEPPDAVWEYTFQGPRGVPMRGLQRVLAAGGRTYLIEWRAPRTAWAGELQRLAVVLAAFGPAPGA
jgi:eukaryotic-like serine/threonine-protein kinase